MTLIVVATSLGVGICIGFLLGVWLIVDWERQSQAEERKKKSDRLLEECGWFESCDGLYRR